MSGAANPGAIDYAVARWLMQWDDFVRVPSPYQGLRVRVQGPGEPLSAEGQRLARRAALELRSGLESGAPVFLDVARALFRALGREPGSLHSGNVLESARLLGHLASELEGAFEVGALVAELEPETSLHVRDALPELELPPPPPRRAEQATTFFEVRFVDEIGQAIPNLPVEVVIDGAPHDVTTNAAGVALVEGVTGSSAVVNVPDVEALEEIVGPRWEKPRTGNLPVESNTIESLFDGGALPAISLRAALPHRVVLKPPLGKLFVELWDRSGRVRHAKCPYRIDGPQSFEGTTDEQGRLLHDDVVPGDYTLSFDVTIELPDGPVVDTYETPLPVLDKGAGAPQVRLLGAVPRVRLARIGGLLFETNKSFLLPASVAVFERLRELYAENDPSELLVVGHTDTTGEPDINDPLSLERAENTVAFLRDDVDAWLAMYEPNVPAARRWGDDEDQAMLFSMPDFESKPPNEDPVRWFQRTRGLAVDGIAGPKTRRQLITEYMRLDGASLGGDAPEFDITITSHGCGENFPLDETGQELDADPKDDQEDVLDRRVELFFFDKEFGILPPPPGKNSKQGSTEYPEWRRRAILSEFSVDEPFERPCHLDLVVVDSDGTTLANQPCKLHADGGVHDLTTDADGRLVFGPLPPDDFLLEVGSLALFVTSFSPDQGTRSIVLPMVEA